MLSDTDRVEQRLRLELERGMPRLDFDPLLERRYREGMRSGRRLARMLYFLAPVLLFGAVAIGGATRLGRFELELFLPLAALAALANSGRLAAPLSTGVNALATAALWCGLLILQYRSLAEGPALPPELPGVAMLAAALLCGFRLRPMLLGIGAGTLLELALLTWTGAPGQLSLHAATVAALGACALGGACLAEASRRRQWIAGEIADVAVRTDPLTGLCTRAEFNERFPLILAQARREHRPVSLALLAVEGFRAINEKLGPLYGDLVLRSVAAPIRQRVRRPLDLSARFSASKLVLVWYGAEAPAVARLLREQIQAVRSAGLERPSLGQTPPLNLCAGGLTLVPEDRCTAAEVLKVAEALMYQACASGGGSIVLRDWTAAPGAVADRAAEAGAQGTALPV